MVSTRRQTASAMEGQESTTQTSPNRGKPTSKKQRSPTRKNEKEPIREEKKIEIGTKRDADKVAKEGNETQGATVVDAAEPPKKKVKAEDGDDGENKGKETQKGATKNEAQKDNAAQHVYQSGTIERGHIYFFYRPKVELDEASSIDNVQCFYMLLVPRPPAFSTETAPADIKAEGDNADEMKLLQPGVDAVPAPAPVGQSKLPFRLITIGKKSLPDPEARGGGRGGGHKQVFWAVVTTVGDDLHNLENGLGGKEYETKTRGTRHQGPARLAARGAYAIINSQGRTPSSRETHLGYHLSHPDYEHLGEVQKALGIHEASSFIVQIKNPLAPNTGAGRTGLPSSKRAEYPDHIMKEVFSCGDGKEHSRGREEYGLKFASIERRELLDYEGTELLFIAARAGDEGLEASLGEGRGEALAEAEHDETHEDIKQVLTELALDSKKIPAEPLKGEWI